MKKVVFRAVWPAALAFFLCVSTFAAELLVPVGKVVGLSLAEGSVTVVAFDEVLGAPAKAAGLEIGDEILTVDGAVIDSAQDLQNAMTRSDGTVRLRVARNKQEVELVLNPSVSSQGPKLGVFVREGITGIGTVTYYDPDSREFGALGHGVSDPQGNLAQMETGNIYAATVTAVRQGVAGDPGQLKGAVTGLQPIGTLRRNCRFGIFGSCSPFAGEALPTGDAQLGSAKILSNISGDAVEAFHVEIVRLAGEDNETGRDMMLKVTDEKLLTTTGGIVAGMSGSPIIQDGKLVGAVTHVLVNDPTRGYGIFIENMLDAAE